MTENLMAGCGIKVLRREQDLLTLIWRIWDSFKIDGGMRDTGYGIKTGKSQVMDVTRRTAAIVIRRDREKHFHSGGMAGLSLNIGRIRD